MEAVLCDVADTPGVSLTTGYVDAALGFSLTFLRIGQSVPANGQLRIETDVVPGNPVVIQVQATCERGRPSPPTRQRSAR